MSDYGTIIEPGTIRFERLLPGPVERLWAYITEPEKRGKWLASGDIELRVGGDVEHVFFRDGELAALMDEPPPKYAQYRGEHRMSGRVTACEPPRLLSYTWLEESGESEVSFELEPRGDDVLMVLTHRRLATRADLLGVAGGWHNHLDILADHLNGKEPQPFWAAHMRLEAEYETRIPAEAEATP